MVTDLITDKLFGDLIGNRPGLKIYINEKASSLRNHDYSPFIFLLLFGARPIFSTRKRYFRLTAIYITMDAVALSINDNNEEFIELANTIDINIKQLFIQKSRYPAPNSFLGKGKIEEIATYVKDNDIKIALVNGILKPLQHYNLEKNLGIECVDKIGLILRIFALRSMDIESKLQIESAKLKYQIPLLREWIHRSESGEHPGFLAGGEYRIDLYYDLIKKQLNKISGAIRKIRADRQIKRNNRRKMGYATLALVGYTNAGKSSLFNILTKSSVFVDEKLFSTLSTRSRKVSESIKPIILTDTIGFIEDMPHWLIESFQPTLEEIKEADYHLWIFDGKDSKSELIRKYNVCKNILNMIENDKHVPVLTKIDLLNESEINEKRFLIKELTSFDPCVVSSKTNMGIDNLINQILRSVRPPLNVHAIFKNVEKTQQMISWLYNNAVINNIKYDKRIIIDFWCDKKILEVLRSRYKDIIDKLIIS